MSAADRREELEAVLWRLASRRSTVGQALAAADRYADARVAGIHAAVAETSKGYEAVAEASARAYLDRPRCGHPLTSGRRNEDYCGRPAGHPGIHRGGRSLDRRRWARPGRAA